MSPKFNGHFSELTTVELNLILQVNANGFLSFRTAREYAGPGESLSSYPHIIAPYWTHNDITQEGQLLVATAAKHHTIDVEFVEILENFR